MSLLDSPAPRSSGSQGSEYRRDTQLCQREGGNQGLMGRGQNALHLDFGPHVLLVELFP